MILAADDAAVCVDDLCLPPDVERMKVEIWSDVVCPWCYIGKRRFETALGAFDGRDDVEVHWRSFQLNPEQPRGVRDDPRRVPGARSSGRPSTRSTS